MKKLIKTSLFAGIILSSIAFGNVFSSNLSNNKIIESSFYDCNYGQCQATAKSTGNQCKHCVSKSGDTYCWQHK